MDKCIWVWIEHKHGEIREASLELLGEARRLATCLKGKACGVVFGSGVSQLTNDLIAYGADTVYQFEDPHLDEYNVDLYLQAFSLLRDIEQPTVVLFAATPNGNSLGPRLAARFKSGFAADTVKISDQPDGALRINRATCSGKAHSVLAFAAGATTIVTMKPGSVGMDRPNRSRKGAVVKMELGEVATPRTEVRGVVKADPKVVALEEAECVIAGGCGFRVAEQLDLLRSMADAIGGAVAGSKPIIDENWLPRRRLVGQSSGRRLSPRLFIAVGVSGSSHFVEGMKDSRMIVAINLDKAAPIMKLADLAVVGDLRQVLPEVTEQINQQKKRAV